MGSEFRPGKYSQRGLKDYLDQAAKGLYLLSSALFVWGLWVDWRSPGEVLIAPLSFAQEPHVNSGLFIGAILLLCIGVVLSKLSVLIEEHKKRGQDQSQEWDVERSRP